MSDDQPIQELPCIEINKSVCKGFDTQVSTRIYVSGESSDQALNNFFEVYKKVIDNE